MILSGSEVVQHVHHFLRSSCKMDWFLSMIMAGFTDQVEMKGIRCR